MTPDRTPSPLSLLVPGWALPFIPSAVGAGLIVAVSVVGAFVLAGVM